MKQSVNIDNKTLEKIRKISPKLYEELEKTWEELSTIEKMIDEVPPQLQKSLANYYVIRLVSYFENECKRMTELLIDKKSLSFDMKLSISLSDLYGLKQTGEITAGKIVASTTNFQNLDRVNFVYSQLLKIDDFFAELAKDYDYMKPWKQEMQELLTLRHEIVHENHNFEFKNIVQLLSKRFLLMNFTVSGKFFIHKQLKKLGKEGLFRER